jgi:hypothetical protein
MNQGFVADRPEFEWLCKEAGGWQFGEQRILLAITAAIGVMDGQCVEIGAGNGDTLPLTIDPFYKSGNECLLFEVDPESLGMLMVRYPQATHRGEFVPDNAKEFAPFPLLVVIDVDSIDSIILEEVLSRCTPHIVMVEHFDRCHPENADIVQKVPSWLLGEQLSDGFTIQDNAATLEAIAAEHSYTRLGTTRVNSILVHDSLVEKVANYVPG